MCEELKKNVKRLFELLERKESNDDGDRIFNPTYITSCRAHVVAELNVLMPRIKELALKD